MHTQTDTQKQTNRNRYTETYTHRQTHTQTDAHRQTHADCVQRHIDTDT